MKSIYYLLIVLLFASCQAVRVQTDYEKDTDFSNYATYNYYGDLETGLGALEEKRLIKVLDAAMQGKGLLLSEEPDFFINIQSEIFQAPNNNTVGLGVGGAGRNVGGGVSVGIPIGQAKVQREIIFDFIDSQKEQLFWQAVSSSSFNENNTPVERELKLQEIVEKVLSKYPPKSRK
ncbi:DUF4136 domain-containing protein [Maribacter sp. ANRC-HE7]|uniref:DUF4136 domain-containing protein n=1 Tax=Maribacter aquimaris TaxID=2737171 RepID=A0ABR7V4H4_9FLAO|nr:DUF4136 domain-containing protein [Maribacter aquimaris]MBD0778206.1 DUF4136 domain-containing protein [Maribacter aquimaris]